MTFSVIVMLLGVPLFFFSTQWLYLHETDEALLVQKEEFVLFYAPKIKDNEISLFNTLNRDLKIEKYQETIDAAATEQIDNKFEFYKKEDGGYTNKGIYILYYDTDLTIKEAN